MLEMQWKIALAALCAAWTARAQTLTATGNWTTSSSPTSLASIGSGSAYASACDSSWEAWRSASEHYTPSDYTTFLSTGTVDYTVTDTIYASDTCHTSCGTICYAGSHTILSTSVDAENYAYTTLTSTAPTFAVPSPTCSVALSDCTDLWSSYSSSSSAWASAAITTAPSPSEPACDTCKAVSTRCTIDPASIDVYYFPVTSNVTRNLCTNWPAGGEATSFPDYPTTTYTPVTTGPYGVVSGKTLYAGNVYFSIATASAHDPCGGAVGATHSGSWIALPSSEVQSMRGYPKNDIPYSFNFADFNTPIPYSAYYGQPACQVRLPPCSVVYDNEYFPQIIMPAAIRQLDPSWSTCSLGFFGLADPPTAVQTAPFGFSTSTSVPAEPAQSSDLPPQTTEADPGTTTAASPSPAPEPPPVSTNDPIQTSVNDPGQPSTIDPAPPASTEDPGTVIDPGTSVVDPGDPATSIANPGDPATSAVDPGNPATSVVDPGNPATSVVNPGGPGNPATTVVNPGDPGNPATSVVNPGGPGQPASSVPGAPPASALVVITAVPGSSVAITAPPITAPTSATITLGSSTLVVDPTTGVTIGPGTTLTPGAPPITLPGSTTLSVGTTGVIISAPSGVQTIPFQPTTGATPTTPVITVGGSSITAILNPTDPANPSFVVDGTTLTPGGATATISGTPVFIPSSGSSIVVGTQTIPLTPVSQPSSATITAGGQTFTVDPTSSAVVLAPGTTLSLGGPALTVSGTTISVGSSGVVIVAPSLTSTVAIVTGTGASSATITAGDQTFTVDPTGSAVVVAPGTTLSVGGPALTVSGTTISVGPSGVVIVAPSLTSTVAIVTGIGASGTQTGEAPAQFTGGAAERVRGWTWEVFGGLMAVMGVVL